MTGSQCDNVSTPAYLTASAILQQTAHHMFDLAVKEFQQRYPNGAVFDPPGLRIWKNLRRFSELYVQLQTVNLQPHEDQALHEALTFAHAFWHAQISSAGPVQTVDHCYCPVAYNIRELDALIAEVEPERIVEAMSA